MSIMTTGSFYGGYEEQHGAYRIVLDADRVVAFNLDGLQVLVLYLQADETHDALLHRARRAVDQLN